MRILCDVGRSRFSTSRIPLALGFPFQYTLMPEKFAFMDTRFTQIPLNRQLQAPEKQHIHIVLKKFESLLNGRGDYQGQIEQQYIFKLLKAKVLQLQEIKKQAKIQMRMKFDLESVVKSSGYYEIKTLHNVSLAQEEVQEIHNYRFVRKKESLQVSLKQKKEAVSSQEQLKKDILDKMQNPSKQAIEQIKKMKFSKEAQLYDKVVEGLLSIGKKDNQTLRFQPFYIVDQIKGVLQCSMEFQGRTFKEDEVQFDTKWVYYVNNLQSEDLKKYRRKKLFDFQFWNRGTFFKIKDFSKQIKNLW